MENGAILLSEERPRRIWPLLVIAIVIAFYFHSILFLSKVPYVSDLKTYYYPGWTYFSQAFRNGGPSFWCSGIYCGFPLFADSEMGLFYPLNLLLFPLPATMGFNYSIVLHYLLGGCFTFIYCRRLRISRPAALFVSIPFVLGGFFLAHMVHPNAVATAAWMPLFLYFLERALSEGRLSFYVAAGGVLGLQSLSGFIMVPLIEVVIAFFYVLFYPAAQGESRRRRILQALGGLAITAGLGAGLSMIQNLPTYNLVQSSYRAGGLSGRISDVGSLPPAQLAGLAFPRLFGKGGAQGNYLGAWTFEEAYAYIGILPLLFAPAALYKPRRWHAVFFLCLGAASLLLILGDRGLLWPLLRLLPGFNVLKGASRFLLTFNLSALLLGGMGFERWRNGDLSERMRSRLVRFWVIAAAVTTTIIALFVLLYRFNPLGFRDLASAAARPFLAGIKLEPQAVVDGIYAFFTSLRLDLLIPLVTLGLFLLIIRNGRGQRRPNRLKVGLAVIIAVADVLIVASLILHPVPRSKVEYRPEVVNVLDEASGGARVALVKEPGVNRGDFSLSSNQLLPYGLEDAYGFSTIPPARLDRFLGLLNASTSTSAMKLLDIGLSFSNLVRIKGVPYNLSTPFSIPGGLGANRYMCPQETKGKELRFLLDGEILETEESGRLYIKLNSISRGQIRTHPVLLLEKDAGAGEYLLEVINGEQAATFKVISFKSPGYGGGRTALEVRVPLDRLGEADEIIATTLSDRNLEGTRLLALTLIDEDGRGVPLGPWPVIYSDGRYAVYELPDALPRAFTAWDVMWTEDWRQAVDLTWNEGILPEEIVLAEDEVDATLRAAISSLGPPEHTTHIEIVEEDGGHMRLHTSGEDDTILVINVDYLPGWKARVDGAETPLFSAYGFLHALYLPAGEHEVELDYRSPGLAAGIPITAASLALMLLLLVIFRRREAAAAKAGGDGERTIPPPDPGGISAFFPCYNDSATLQGLIEKALEVLGDLAGDFEVIIVDDGSSDTSGAVIDSLAARYDRVRVVRHDHNRGYGAALRSGIKTSTKDWVFYTDSDGQYDVEDLRRLHAYSGAVDVVNGYKQNRSDPWYRIVLGSAYNAVIRLIFAIPIRDTDCDFRLMRGDIVRGLDLRSEGGAICVEMVKGLQASGARFAEMPVGHFPREVGKSQFFHVKNLVVMGGELASLWWRLLKQGEV
ncbi:MAG: glycosyltransferase [Actinobacteria bacterium]|nr:MAG: glycosyltransferase [Actinomycetota bacterium]